MANQEVIITIVVYNLILICIGLIAKRKNKTEDDFFLANRGLGPWVAALSASASSSSAWTLLGVSGAAYAWGLSAVWLLPGVLIGYYISWTWVAPRLMELSQETGEVSLAGVLFHNFDEKEKQSLMRLSVIIITSTLILYVAAQFQAAGTTFSSILGISQELSIILGALVILIYTFIGGFWAVSLTDSIQAVLMVIVALILPWMLLLIGIGGFENLSLAIDATWSTEEQNLTGLHTGLMGAGFALGTIAIGFGYPGQPFVVNRFMAAKDIQAIKRGRIIAIIWAIIIFTGMIVLGLSAKVMYTTVGDPESVLFFVSNRLFGPIFAGIITAVVSNNLAGWDPGNASRFRLMIFSSLSAIVASLMPYAFLLNSGQIDWVWNIAMLGIYLLGFTVYNIRSFVLARHDLNGYVSFVVSILGASATLVQFAALIGMVTPSLGIYFLGVFYLLIQSCIAFTRLVTQAILKPDKTG